MESNSDLALRAKDIAEKKFLAKDIRGAKRFALKAQKVSPELDGISEMLMTLEVYISAEDEKCYGESNWYGILGVTPVADDETVGRQYKKLARSLHPAKNRSIGAEGAFQLVSQAWSLLSDKHKRIAYDQRCLTAHQHQQINQTTRNVPSPADSQMWSHKSNDNHYSINFGKKKSTSFPLGTRKKEHPTFWTSCHRCKMQYEYIIVYRNHNLLCPNCHEPYYASEIHPPSTKIYKASPSTHASGSQNRTLGGSHCGNELNLNVPSYEPTGIQAAATQAYEKAKQDRQKAPAVARKEEALRRKNYVASQNTADASFMHFDFAKRRKGVEECGSNKVEKMKLTNCEGETHPQMRSSCYERHSFRKRMSMCDSTCRVNIKCLLMEKALEQICEKLNERDMATMVLKEAGEDVGEDVRRRETSNVKDDGSLACGSMCNPIVLCESEETERRLPPSDSEFVKAAYLDSKLVEKMSVDVRLSAFHDFDKEKTEKCFKNNQVWAVYDDLDGMPRHYAMIQTVLSENPFKVKLSWLRFVTHNGPGLANWFSNSFSKTCGEFEVGRAKICDSVDCFSHVVRWTETNSKAVCIFPQKGDVWALYRNWSAEWNELTEYEIIHKYDMVEVLENYDEEFGVIVIPLIKVVGFKVVFHQSLDPSELRRIPNQEISRFSHQVPCHSLTWKEGSKSLRGCRELDPAAIPSHFLEVLSTNEQIEFVEAMDCDGNTIAYTEG